MPVRANEILRVRKVWLLPVLIAGIFVALMSVIYIGSVVDPTTHLHDLPVMIVDQDVGATVHGEKVDIGAELSGALEQSSGVTSRLRLENASLAQAKVRMNRGDAYATLVIPTTLTRSVLLAFGDRSASAGVPAKATVQLLENQRLGTLGTSLAAGVMTPAITKISPHIGAKLKVLATPGAASDPVTSATLADPVTLTTAEFRPLPAHSALGLSAFYIALLAIMGGFIGSTLINSSVDSALGYGATEIGPHWRQRRPVPIDRRNTLLVKYAAATIAAPILTGVLMAIAVAALHMYAPDWLLLWGLCAFASVMIAYGTLTLLAIVGSIGQLLAMILLVYLSLASSGGTVPVEALPGVFQWFAHIEPLRQVLRGTRAVMYFGAQGDAGLNHSLLMIGCELASWGLLGLAITTIYDRKGLYRLTPDLWAFINRTIDQRVADVDVNRDSAAAVSSRRSGEELKPGASPTTS
jgi:YhgE/Pip-like protein